MSVAAAVLAAGRGSRMGGDTPKVLLELRGRPILFWSLDAATSSGLQPVILVVGHEQRAIAEQASRQGLIVRHARRWHRGIAHSLHAALEALSGKADVSAVCIGLADQPLVGADAYRRLAIAHRDGAAFAVATYHGVRVNPVLLARSVWPAALELRGDIGARALIGALDVTEVDCTGTGDPRDVDTLDDLRALDEEMQ